MIRIVGILVMVTVLIGIPSQTVVQTDTARRQDLNAIYSSLLKSNDAVYLLAAETTGPAVASINMKFQKCVVLPAGYEIASGQILAEIDMNKAGTGTIRADLKLPHPYTLLNNDDVKAFRDAKAKDWLSSIGVVPQQPAVPMNPKFQGATESTDRAFDRLTLAKCMSPLANGNSGASAAPFSVC